MAKKPSVPVSIPGPLIEAIKSKRVVLFLGAGASKEAKNASGKNPPDASQLRDILAEKFFQKPMPHRDVMAVAEMAIASSGGSTLVYEAVRQAFEGYQPSEAHKLVSMFNWRMIATTNYDTLLERAYSDTSKRIQTLVRFVKDDEPIEDRMQAATNPVAYESRGRDEDAEKILKEAIARDPDDKSAHQAIAILYLRRGHFDADAVEQHLRNSLSAGDHNFEERYMLAQFFYYRGRAPAAKELFDSIDERAPDTFRRTAPRKESVIAMKLPRYSGMVEGIKPKFFFIRSGAYPTGIFAHNSSVDPEVLNELSIGRDVNFRMSFNRAGPVAVDVVLGRLNDPKPT